MHFQLFIPHGHKPVSGIEAMRQLLLHTEIDGAAYSDCPAPEGLSLVDNLPLPEGVEPLAGRRGHLVYWQRQGQVSYGFKPERQVWRPAAPFGDQAAGRYWIGFDCEYPPSPDELARPYRHLGVQVQLGDGRQWLLPKEALLPRDMILADDGSWRWQLQRQFWDFAIECMNWRRILAAVQVGDAMDQATMAEFLRKALSINYRALPEVVSYLRLINTSNLFALVSHVLLASEPQSPNPNPPA